MNFKKNMSKKLSLLLACVLSSTMMFGCQSADGQGKSDEKITIVWYPNESGGDLEEARNAVGEVVTKATGKDVEHKLTTDYSIAIETMANDKGHLSFMGAQGYIDTNKKNDAVKPLVVPSGKSGTLDDALYYSWLAVNKEDADKYKNGEEYSTESIQGKKMSFVSNSSTSGFKVPVSSIIEEFSSDDKWKDLTQEDLMEGGSDKFFSEVVFGGSHQGSAVNLLNKKVDLAAFCDTVLVNYIDLVSGDFNGVGSTYKIKDKADEPFNTIPKAEFTVISSTPVLNSPIVMNTNLLTEEEQEALLKEFTSDETTNNKKIFLPEGSDGSGFFTKEAEEKFLKVEDSWFNPVRELSSN